MSAIPVIALTGHLGAGKTTLLNHLLRSPGTRIGVVVNDFGELNVDAGLVAGQIDEPASIAGGCICCLPDDGGLDDALAKLADPARRLDAILVEASGLADPVAIARIIGFSKLSGVRPGGLVDVIDAANHFDTVDRTDLPPARYGAASLIVVNKLDRVPEAQQPEILQRVKERVAQRNPRVQVVGTTGGRIDPALLFDATESVEEQAGQLSFRELLVESDEPHDHVHADAVTVRSAGCVDLDALFDLLEQPPSGVFRLKGVVAVQHGASVKTYVVNLVGDAIHVGKAPPHLANTLVAIGMHLDVTAVRERLDRVVRSGAAPASASALRRLQRYRRLSG
ncbi:cobalamin biosynthesis protein CobW [Mycobacterium asiaticum]|uniref:Cobalamin biosynthesis protein CobW n=1 Tax=Mycobacterium asiaticum TaxID=1790 RepID=A0A1A3P2W5_MYCAS|nr:GTP-binding protein [Mycobacterium asiaticum]OBK27619.1 cobalamin biosynthesis protein CobW [Mycobacterium asiaticum]